MFAKTLYDKMHYLYFWCFHGMNVMLSFLEIFRHGADVAIVLPQES